MNNTTRGILTAVAAVGAASMVLALGFQNRALRQQNRDVVARFGKPHPGLLVPAFTAQSLSGTTVGVADGDGGDQQILFFFTTSCEYCRRSLPMLMGIDSALSRGVAPRTKLFAVALDSSTAALRRLVDSTGLSVPILLLPSRRLALLYRVRTVPQLVIVEASGRMIYAREGALVGAGVLDSVVAAASHQPAAPVKKSAVTARAFETR